MKPIDQLKVIALSFLSVIAIVGVLFVVSVVTTKAVAGHHAADSSHATKTETATSNHSADTSEHAATTESAPAHSTDASHGDSHSEKAVATPVGDVAAGSKVFLAKTCATCHKISSLEGANGAIGPALDGLGATAAKRVAGQDAIAYIKASIETPNAHVVEGYPPAMPPMRASMNDEEFTNLVAYLASL